MPRIKTQLGPGEIRIKTLQELRREAALIKKEMEGLQSHFRRFQREYGDVEDRVHAFDLALQSAYEAHGITEEEVEAKPNPLDQHINLEDLT